MRCKNADLVCRLLLEKKKVAPTTTTFAAPATSSRLVATRLAVMSTASDCALATSSASFADAVVCDGPRVGHVLPDLSFASGILPCSCGPRTIALAQPLDLLLVIGVHGAAVYCGRRLGRG